MPRPSMPSVTSVTVPRRISSEFATRSTTLISRWEVVAFAIDVANSSTRRGHAPNRRSPLRFVMDVLLLRKIQVQADGRKSMGRNDAGGGIGSPVTELDCWKWRKKPRHLESALPHYLYCVNNTT